MKTNQFTPEQAVHVLKQAESGAETLAAICRKMGVSQATFYAWKKKHAGMASEFIIV